MASPDWFSREVARHLWLPAPSATTAHGQRIKTAEQHHGEAECRRARRRTRRRRKRHKRARRGRRSHQQRIAKDKVDPRRPTDLRTSWFSLRNEADEDQGVAWQASLQLARELALPAPPASGPPDPPDTPVTSPQHKRQRLGQTQEAPAVQVNSEDTAELARTTVNSTMKVRIYPTTSQRLLLDQMFATQRAVYNKMVAMYRANRVCNVEQLRRVCAPVSAKKNIRQYFANRSAGRRHRTVHADVFMSAYRDLESAFKSSRTLFLKQTAAHRRTTYPELKFKSRTARSNSIRIKVDKRTNKATGAITYNNVAVGNHAVRFHKSYFASDPWIWTSNQLSPIQHSFRLQRLRSGEFYLCVPHHVVFEQTQSTRVCAIDPGVRNFATVYDPSGRTFSVWDEHDRIKRRFKRADRLRERIATVERLSKMEAGHVGSQDRTQPKVRTRVKARLARQKRARRDRRCDYHREKYRLGRELRFTLRKIARLITDMHQKLSYWLSTHYSVVILPTFPTADLVSRERENGRPRQILSATARTMMAQSHYRFKMLLKCKMARTGGRVIDCTEEYTSKTCSHCGVVNMRLGGNDTFRCSSCGLVRDRDVNAAKNILLKNISLLPPP